HHGRQGRSTRRMTLRKILAGGLLALCLQTAGPALAQGAQLPFLGLPAGSAQTVEVSANSLSIDQATQMAVFAGEVRVGVGDLRLSAERVEVVYATGEDSQPGRVQALRASGNVVFTNGVES